MTIQFSACPKCQGDVQLKKDIYGMFINCLQCGMQKDLDAPNAAFEIAKTKTVAAKTKSTGDLLRAA